jgi:hypothetical protein
MAIRLSPAQQDVVVKAIRAALTGTGIMLTGRQRRSLEIAYDKIQDSRVHGVRHGSRSGSHQYPFTTRDARESLAEAAILQDHWIPAGHP